MIETIIAFVDGELTERERSRRARVRVQHLLALLQVAIGVPYAFIYDAVGVAWSLPFFIPLSLLSPLALVFVTRRGHVAAGGRIITVVAFTFIFAALIIRGGMSSNSAAWLLVIPVVSTLVVGPRFGIHMALVTAAAFAGLWTAERMGVELPRGLSPELLAWMPLIDYPAIALSLGGMLYVQAGIWERAERDALAAAKARYTFLATMSHEIRTPLHGVLGLTELLLDSTLDADQRELATTVMRSGERLRVLLDDVLDYSKTDSGKIEIEALPVDPRALCRETVQLWESAVSERPIRLETQVDADVPAWVQGDPTKLRQILDNLVSNALKFTEAGHVRVAVSAHDDRLQIRVEDTGIGMSADAAERIFEAFRQADGTTTRRYGGTGLGLAICKRLVELMGGEISVSSELGVGSTFTVTLPLVRVQREAVGAPDAPGTLSIEGLDILVAEDNPINQLVTRRLLERRGVHVRVADDGEECVEQWRGRAPDLILMDCQMPVCDGYEAARRIRAEGGELPIIALTANSMADDRARSLAAGMDEHLGKPIDADALVAVIARHCVGGRVSADEPRQRRVSG